MNEHNFQEKLVCSHPRNNMKMQLRKVALLAMSSTATLIPGLAIRTSLPQAHGGAIDTIESRVAVPDHNGDSHYDDRSFEINGNSFVKPQKEIPTSNERHRELIKPATSSTCINILIVAGSFVSGSSLNRTINESYLACETLDGKQYRVNGIPDHVIKAKEKSVIDGVIELDLPEGAYLDERTASLKLPSQVGLKFKAKSGSGSTGIFDRSRRSLAVSGTRTALVVRIVASNAPLKSEASLSNAVFGNGADGTVDPMTLKSLYTTCSHGQLTFVQASDRNGRSINIRKGATTVTVSTPVEDAEVVTNAAIEELNSQFSITNPRQLADHVMFFLPFSMGGANADMFGTFSRFGVDPDSPERWIEAGVLAHEIGHNLGMSHSSGPGNSEIEQEYGDHTCTMGNAAKETGPFYCFNGAKSWFLGWYSSRNYVYNAKDGIWNGRLIGQVDYMNGNDSTSKVVLKLNSASSTDYYIVFNRIKSGTANMGSNMVVITKAGNEGGSDSKSYVMGTLKSGESLKLQYDIDYLEFKVNQINLSVNPAYADVTVKMVCVTNCGATLETWTGIGGATIADLMAGTNNLTKKPSKTEVLGSLLESPSNIGDNYGIRIKGWLVPPVSGSYQFWIASDDNGEFWLSTNNDSAHKTMLCRVDWASSREWDKSPEQKSTPVSLVGGQAYYFEALMKESYGNDNLAIAWQYPGKVREVIPAEYLRTMNPFDIGATLERWTGIGGLTIADLMSGTNNLAREPSTTEYLRNLDVLESPSNIGDNYGLRMKGWLLPPVNGLYQFAIASDDNGEFWLSTDDDPSHKAKMCQIAWAPPRTWDMYPEQKSAPITLVAGKAYYYEALLKEGMGSDYMALAWQYPGQNDFTAIPANFSLVTRPELPTYCGCESCTESVWNAVATDADGSYSCGARIEWLQSVQGYSETSACTKVFTEFPTVCLCDAASCTAPPTEKPSLRPTKKPSLRPTRKPTLRPTKKPTRKPV